MVSAVSYRVDRRGTGGEAGGSRVVSALGFENEIRKILFAIRSLFLAAYSSMYPGHHLAAMLRYLRESPRNCVLLLSPSAMSAVLVCGPVEYIHPELKALAESGVEIVVRCPVRFPAIDSAQLPFHSTSTRLLAHTSSLVSQKEGTTLRSSPSIETTIPPTKSESSTPTSSIIFHLHCDSYVISAPGTIKLTSKPVPREVCRNLKSRAQLNSSTLAGIAVSSTPGVVDASTATTGMFLIISALRSFWKMQQTAQRGNFKEGCEVGNDPEGKVLGIIGLGGIGKALAKRALGFDMKIQYHNRKPLAPAALAEFPAGSITYVESMDILLSTSDVVSLSIPLNEKTKGSFGAAQFAAMKQSACFINTARGAIVDESAMLQALKSGKVSSFDSNRRIVLTKIEQLGSVGLDVFPNEPHINPELLAMDNVVVLPHAGTHSIETQRFVLLNSDTSTA